MQNRSVQMNSHIVRICNISNIICIYTDNWLHYNWKSGKLLMREISNSISGNDEKMKIIIIIVIPFIKRSKMNFWLWYIKKTIDTHVKHPRQLCWPRGGLLLHANVIYLQRNAYNMESVNIQINEWIDYSHLR